MKTLDHEWRSPHIAPMRRSVRILWCDRVITRGNKFDAGNGNIRWYDSTTGTSHEEADVVGWTDMDGPL